MKPMYKMFLNVSVSASREAAFFALDHESRAKIDCPRCCEGANEVGRSSRFGNRERRSTSYSRRDRFDRPGPSQNYHFYRNERQESEKKIKEERRNNVRDTLGRVAVTNRDVENQNRTTSRGLYRKPYIQARKTEKYQPEKAPNDVSELPKAQLSEMVDNSNNGRFIMNAGRVRPDTAFKRSGSNFLGRNKNKFSSDLRNGQGLNSKKGLPFVHSPLNVKLSFDRLPHKPSLSLFLKTHKCCGLKRLNSKGIEYCTRARDASTLERICAQKYFTIDNSKVTVTPMHQLMKRPPYQRTIFDDKQRRTMIGRSEKWNVTHSHMPSEDKTDDRSKDPAKKRKIQAPTHDIKSADAIHNVTAPTHPTESKLDGTKPKFNTNTIKVANKVININEHRERREEQSVDDSRPVHSINEDSKPKLNATKNEVGNKAARINAPSDRNERCFETGPQSKQAAKRSNIDEVNIPSKRRTTLTPLLQNGNDNDELNDDEIQELLLRRISLDKCGGSDRKIPDEQSLDVEKDDGLRLKKANHDPEEKPHRLKGKALEKDDDELNDNEIEAMLSEIIVLDECGQTDRNPITNEEVAIKVETESKLRKEKYDLPTLPLKSQGTINETENYDELSDTEIHAMLAGSVVLDECGESDSE